MCRQHMRRIVLCFVLAASAAAFAPLGAQLRSGSPSWQGCRIRPPSGVRRWRWRMDSDTPPARVGKKTEGMRRSAEERLQAAENKVVVLGLSHKTASVDIREKLAVPEDKWQVLATRLCVACCMRLALAWRDTHAVISHLLRNDHSTPPLSECVAPAGRAKKYRAAFVSQRSRFDLDLQ